MTPGHVLRRLVNPLQLGRIVDGPPAAHAEGQGAAVATAQTDLSEEDLLLAALRVGLDVFGGGFKEFEVLSDEDLVVGELFVIELEGEGNALFEGLLALLLLHAVGVVAVVEAGRGVKEHGRRWLGASFVQFGGFGRRRSFVLLILVVVIFFVLFLLARALGGCFFLFSGCSCCFFYFF